MYTNLNPPPLNETPISVPLVVGREIVPPIDVTYGDDAGKCATYFSGATGRLQLHPTP